MKSVKTTYWMLRQMGPRLIGLRAGVYLRRMLGTTRRQFPARSWESIRAEEICRPGTPTETTAYAAFKAVQGIKFFFAVGKPPEIPERLVGGADRQPALAERLRLIADDRSVYCFHTPTTASIDWNRNPLNGGECAGNRTWCEIPDFNRSQGDIRLFWEPGRAAWAIDLARGSARGILPEAGEIFWRWVDSWSAACPPWQGPHWKCGQESFVRLLALTFGFWSLANDSATTPERWTQMMRIAWATGYRIDHHISYARSQNNNHALSEACGLMLVGHLFPELREAEKWFEKGRNIFSEELVRQVSPDGSYVQHSMNYHRVMLQTAVVAALLARWHGQPLDDSVMRSIGTAEEFLFQMLDPETGRTPLYGNNDGAWVLPLDECDFSDYRGAVQSAHYLTTGLRRFSVGSWDEDLLWLFGAESLDSPMESKQKPEPTAFRDGGYYTLRSDRSWGMIRCHTYRDRPGHYDPLHFDLWHQGQNVLRDCGTYEYFPPEGLPMEDYFQLIRSHNTVEIDGRSPVERVSRFLYFPWPKAALRWYESPCGAQYFEGESYDYERRPWAVLHRRAILGLDGDVWLIVDDLLGQGKLTATLRWHLADVPVAVDLATHSAVLESASGDWNLRTICGADRIWNRWELIRGRGDGDSVQGFASPYYGERIPIPVVEAEIAAELPLRLFTVASPGKKIDWQRRSECSGQSFRLSANDRAWNVELGPIERSSPRIVKNVKLIESETMNGRVESGGGASVASAGRC